MKEKSKELFESDWLRAVELFLSCNFTWKNWK